MNDKGYKYKNILKKKKYKENELFSFAIIYISIIIFLLTTKM